MKKILALVSVVSLMLVTSCNYNMYDFTYEFDYAYIQLQNGEVVEGPVTSWRDYEDGDQLQVTIDGKTYLVHSANCTLIKYGNQI